MNPRELIDENPQLIRKPNRSGTGGPKIGNAAWGQVAFAQYREAKLSYYDAVGPDGASSTGNIGGKGDRALANVAFPVLPIPAGPSAEGNAAFRSALEGLARHLESSDIKQYKLSGKPRLIVSPTRSQFPESTGVPMKIDLYEPAQVTGADDWPRNEDGQLYHFYEVGDDGTIRGQDGQFNAETNRFEIVSGSEQIGWDTLDTSVSNFSDGTTFPTNPGLYKLTLDDEGALEDNFTAVANTEPYVPYEEGVSAPQSKKPTPAPALLTPEQAIELNDISASEAVYITAVEGAEGELEYVVHRSALRDGAEHYQVFENTQVAVREKLKALEIPDTQISFDVSRVRQLQNAKFNPDSGVEAPRVFTVGTQRMPTTAPSLVPNIPYGSATGPNLETVAQSAHATALANAESADIFVENGGAVSPAQPQPLPTLPGIQTEEQVIAYGQQLPHTNGPEPLPGAPNLTLTVHSQMPNPPSEAVIIIESIPQSEGLGGNTNQAPTRTVLKGEVTTMPDGSHQLVGRMMGSIANGTIMVGTFNTAPPFDLYVPSGRVATYDPSGRLKVLGDYEIAVPAGSPAGTAPQAVPVGRQSVFSADGTVVHTDYDPAATGRAQHRAVINPDGSGYAAPLNANGGAHGQGTLFYGEEKFDAQFVNGAVTEATPQPGNSGLYRAQAVMNTPVSVYGGVPGLGSVWINQAMDQALQDNPALADNKIFTSIHESVGNTQFLGSMTDAQISQAIADSLNGPVLLEGGYKGHSMGVVLYKGDMFITNRGEGAVPAGSSNFFGTGSAQTERVSALQHFRASPPESLNLALQKLRTAKKLPEADAMKYFGGLGTLPGLKAQPDSVGPFGGLFKDPGVFENFNRVAQRTGNCFHTSQQTAARVAMWAMAAEDLGQSGVPVTRANIEAHLGDTYRSTISGDAMRRQAVPDYIDFRMAEAAETGVPYNPLSDHELLGQFNRDGTLTPRLHMTHEQAQTLLHKRTQMIREFMAERGYNIVEPDYTNLPEAAYQRQDIQMVGGGEHNFQGSVADLVVADDQKYTYHPNGKVETLNKYIDGELARTTTYDETGNAQSRTDYEMFQRNGQTLTRESIFDLDGDTATPRGEIVKDAAGNIIEETTYFDANSPEGQDGIEARKTVYEQEGDLRKATATDLVDGEWQIREEAWTDSSGFQTKRTDFIDGAKTLETTFVKNNSGSEAGTESLRSGETVFFGPPGQEAKRSVTVFDTGPGNNIISVTQFDGAPGAETVVNTLNFGDFALPTNTVNTGGISSDLVWENDVPGAQSWTNRIMRQGHNVRLPDNFWADAGGQLAMTPEERANFLGFEGDNFEPTPGGKRIVGPDGATVVIDEPTIAIWQQRLSQAGTTVTDLMKGLGDIVYGFGEGIVKGSVGDIVELIDYVTKNGVDETIDHAGKLFLKEFTQTVNSYKRTAVNAALPKLLRQVDDGVLRLLGEDVVEARLREELGRKFDADYRHNITLTDLEASPSTISENPDDLFKRLVPDIVDARADELFRGRIDNIIAGMDDEFVNLVGEDALRRQLRNELNDSVKHEMKTLAVDSFTSSDGILDFNAVDNALRQGADKYKTAAGLSLTESVKTKVISDRVNAVTSGLDIDALKNMPSSYYDELAEGLSRKLSKTVTKEAAIEMFSNVAKAAGPVGLVAGIVVDLGLGTADLVKAIKNGGDPVEIVRALTATVGLDIVFDLGAALVGWVSDNAQEIINVGNDVIDVLDVTDDKRLVDVLFGWIYGG